MESEDLMSSDLQRSLDELDQEFDEDNSENHDSD